MRTLLAYSLLFFSGLAIAAGIEPGEENISQALAMGLQQPAIARPRGAESEGPFDHLVITHAFVIEGAGAPTQGPLNIEVKQDRIVGIYGGEASIPEGAKVIDATGKYVIPGLIDSHFHLGTPSHAYAGALTDPEYVLKLELAHGVTTVRDVGAIMGLEWTLEHKQRSEAGTIAAPA